MTEWKLQCFWTTIEAWPGPLQCFFGGTDKSEPCGSGCRGVLMVILVVGIQVTVVFRGILVARCTARQA